MQRVVAPVAAIVARSCRAYATATEGARGSGAAVASGKVRVGMAAAESPSAGGGKTEVFWMRDPKTGYWIPENRFEEVDVAELRGLLLSKKQV